jgi:hypothetical protein
VTTAQLAEHRSIVISSGAFVCKINGGQQQEPWIVADEHAGRTL